MSGAARASQFSTASWRAFSELTFQVAIRMRRGYPFAGPGGPASAASTMRHVSIPRTRRPHRADPRLGHRRRRGRRRPVRDPPRDVRGLHGVRQGSVVHRGLPPRRGPAAVREHPHRVVRHGAPDDALPRGGAPDHPRLGRWLRTTTRSSSAARDRRPPSTSSWTCSTCGSRTTSTTATRCDRTSRHASGRSSSSDRTSTTATSCPWRESVGDVVTISEDADGRIDLAMLERALEATDDRPLRIGSFSAASNVTGILSDTRAISVQLHRHGALSFWDFAAAGPYVDIEMSAPPAGAATPSSTTRTRSS